MKKRRRHLMLHKATVELENETRYRFGVLRREADEWKGILKRYKEANIARVTIVKDQANGFQGRMYDVSATWDMDLFLRGIQSATRTPKDVSRECRRLADEIRRGILNEWHKQGEQA